MAESLQRVTIDRPFTDGYVSDLPAEQLGPRMAARLENMVFPRGVAEHRRGWAYADGGSAIGSNGYVHGGVAAAAFQRSAATRRVVVLHPSSGAANLYTTAGALVGSVSLASGTLLIPRAMYRDELILCGQDGITPLVRYGGSAGFTPYTLTSGTIAPGERRVTAMSPALPSGFDNGSFFSMTGGDSGMWGAQYSFRVNGGVPTGTQMSVERLSFGLSTTFTSSLYVRVSPFGFTWPGVPVYEAGTLTAPSGGLATATGQGVDWSSVANINVFSQQWEMADGIVIFDSDGRSPMHRIAQVLSGTTIGISSKGYANPSAYKVMRRMPFTDVAVFRSCLFGSGVRQNASRLYYLPPGHDVGLSPKLSAGGTGKYTGAPYDSPDPVKEFETEWVDVPSSLDADPIVALLPTDSALFVVKRGSAYRITGDYPYWRADKAGDACGCLDVRSAITDETGVYWAGDTGIWTVRGQVPFNLAGGPSRPGILTEWRNLMSEGITGPSYGSTSFITCGVAEGHLIVSVKTAAGTSRCYVMDLQAQRWCGTFTNVLPNAAWSSRIPGESDKLYAMQDGAARRVLDLSSMFRPGMGLMSDANGAIHYAVAHTGSTFFTGGTVEREHRLVDVDVATRFYRDGGTPNGQAAVKVAHGDRVDIAGGGDTVVTAGTITADTSGVVHRNEFRPGTRGRRQQLRIEQTTVDGSEDAFEIHEIGGYVRPFGGRR